MRKTKYEEIEHTADWALRVRGSDLAELLKNAAEGMHHLAGAEPDRGAFQTRTLELEALDRESLLIIWLEELLFALETREVVSQPLELEVSNGTLLVAKLVEAPLKALKKQIKAVTYHALKITETEDGLEATVVFDV